MVEYTFSSADIGSGVYKRIGKYGKIIRIRIQSKFTAAPAADMSVAWGVYSGGGKQLFYDVRTARGALAAGAQLENMCGTYDVNIDIDNDATVFYYNGAAAVGSITLDIIDTKVSRNRQFHDKLSGINSYET